MRIFRAVVIGALVTVLVFLWIGWSRYTGTMQVGENCPHSTARSTDVTFESRDGKVRLSARFTPADNPSQTVILVHGLDNCKDDPRLVATEQIYQGMGFATLALDMRGHGQSESDGKLHGFGSLRAYDVLGAFDWLIAKGTPPDSIVFHGQSLGGSAVLLAALRAENLGYVVAEAPILNFDAVLLENGAPRWFLPIFKLVGRMRGFDLSHQPAEACHSAIKAALIFHASHDPVTSVAQLGFVPSPSKCRKVRVEGDWHTGMAAQRPAEFREQIAELLGAAGQ